MTQHDTMDLARRLYSGAKDSVSYALHPNDRDVYRLLETIHANTLILIEQGNLSLQREKTIMTAQEDLKAIVTQLGVDVAAEIDALAAAVAAGDQQAIEDSVAQLKTLSANLQASVAPKPPAAA
jgi:hypothetical protein